MDLFQLKGNDYLLVMDYHSNYPEFATTAERVVAHTKTIFARHQIPVTVIRDSGRQFSSHCFKGYSENYGFDHVTSSPLYRSRIG